MYLANPCGPAPVDAMLREHVVFAPTERRTTLFGAINQPEQRTREGMARLHAAGVPWAADNGCFAARWNVDYWWRFLTDPRQLDHAGTALFATAPDVVADAAATWARSRPWLARIRDLGYPVAYVAQDGLTWLPYGEFDVLFIGGTTQFKIGPDGRRWIADAIDHGVPVHMGRVNSLRRYRLARDLGCASADGTILTYGPEVNLLRVQTWLADTLSARSA